VRVLASTCLPPLPPAACEHVRRPRPNEHVAERRRGATGTDVGVACPWLRGMGQCGQEQRARASVRRNYVCYVN
jgi:hypothetical protein